MKRIISAIIGVFLIGIVIILGIRSDDDNRYIVPFGLTSALIAPMGLSALGYSIKRKDETLQKLAQVSQIDELIEQAETEAEKIKRLNKEKDALLDYIKNETKRISKIERKKILEADAKRILDEYKLVVGELSAMPNCEVNLDNVSEEIKELYNIQSKITNSQHNEDQSRILGILELNYMIHILLDIYRLPVDILVNLIDNFVKRLSGGIQELAKKISRLF